MRYLTCKIQHDKEGGLLLHNLGGGGTGGGLVLEIERGGGVKNLDQYRANCLLLGSTCFPCFELRGCISGGMGGGMDWIRLLRSFIHAGLGVFTGGQRGIRTPDTL